MASQVYFDTSVFLATLGGDPVQGPPIRQLLRELKRDNIRIYTSILTIQEVSVASFRRGSMVTDNHVKVAKLARVVGITKEIALTAAKYEADAKHHHAKHVAGADTIEENRRRKWDCFHLATAVAYGCKTVYSFDPHYSSKRKQLDLQAVLEVISPLPKRPALIADLHDATT